jgi:hypothetical protein
MDERERLEREGYRITVNKYGFRVTYRGWLVRGYQYPLGTRPETGTFDYYEAQAGLLREAVAAARVHEIEREGEQ